MNWMESFGITQSPRGACSPDWSLSQPRSIDGRGVGSRLEAQESEEDR